MEISERLCRILALTAVRRASAGHSSPRSDLPSARNLSHRAAARTTTASIAASSSFRSSRRLRAVGGVMKTFDRRSDLECSLSAAGCSARSRSGPASGTARRWALLSHALLVRQCTCCSLASAGSSWANGMVAASAARTGCKSLRQRCRGGCACWA